MMKLIDELWYTRRDLISDGYDQALERLSQEMPMEIHSVPTGTQCWTWRVPEKWTCEEAYIETLEGERVIDLADHPLHVVSYSLPFEGEVGLEELKEHLHVHPHSKDAVPYVFKVYERDWGMCCSSHVYDGLSESHYRVVIRSQFAEGALKIGEIEAKGQTERTIVFCAHLDHPAMVNDDLTGVVVGLEVMRKLRTRNDLRNTYKFLILPETIGSIAYLSTHEHLIPTFIGGIFLEMLGNDSPHAFQRSFLPDHPFDRAFVDYFVDHEPAGYVAPYRRVIGNDERQFNSPGVRVPMISLSRVEPEGSPTRPYFGYHSSIDNPSIIDKGRLTASCDLILAMIEHWENERFIVNQYKGEVFASGHGIWIDHQTNPEGHQRLFDIMERCDGQHRVQDIARELAISVESVAEVVDLLSEKNLVRYASGPINTTSDLDLENLEQF